MIEDKTPDAGPALDEAVRRKSKRTLIVVLVVSILPVAAAYFVYFTGIGVPRGTVNNGQLFNKPIHVRELFSDQPELLTYFEQEKKWRLLLPITADCPEVCRHNLYTTRQVHIRLGEKSLRVERYAVNLSDEAGQALLQQLQPEHPLLKFASAARGAWLSWLETADTAADFTVLDYYLLVDQEGFAIMRYDAGVHGNLLIKDIKRALKFSIDYQ